MPLYLLTPPTARKVAMTPAQQHAQDETVRVLAFYADEAEGWLKRIDTAEGLCPCQFPLSKCRCPVRRKQ